MTTAQFVGFLVAMAVLLWWLAHPTPGYDEWETFLRERYGDDKGDS